MGQTLPNGIYLPAEGERNCYDGLEGNWRSLDSLISTVAGKASATHTHGNISNDGKVGTTANKPLITGTGGAVQAGAFGNAANTFCEGNDSRLSDARTPVAHTHTKSDVTDLLNSNFIPSANNSYDLGSSSYQWNNLYAKNYYYNGTAWGLDKSNTWSAINSYSAGIELAGNRYAYILPEFAANYSGISILTNSFGKSVKIGTYTTDASNNIVLNTSIGFLELAAGTSIDSNIVRIQPRNGTVAELGTSSNKWTALNGINPGALSLPGVGAEVDRTNWVYDGVTENKYTPQLDGWLQVRCADAVGNYIFVASAGKVVAITGTGVITSVIFGLNVLIPVIAGNECSIRINCAGSKTAYFYPCLGNV